MEKLEQKMGICPKCGCEYREYHNLVFCENVVKE